MSPQNEMHPCIDECLSGYRICQQALQHCLQKGGRHALANHIRTLTDCAQICGVSAGFMLRGSDLQQQVCRLCREACEKCAQSCQNVNDDAEMQQCIDACHACAESCR
jgi:hypothetical protein